MTEVIQLDHQKAGMAILNSIQLDKGGKHALTNRVRWSLRLILNMLLYIDNNKTSLRQMSYDKLASGNHWFKINVGPMEKLLALPLYGWFVKNLKQDAEGVLCIKAFDDVPAGDLDASNVTQLIGLLYDVLADLDARAAARRAAQ